MKIADSLRPECMPEIIYSNQFTKVHNEDDYSLKVNSPLTSKDDPLWCVVNMRANPNVIVTWLVSSPHLVDKIHVVAPSMINDAISQYFKSMNEYFND